MKNFITTIYIKPNPVSDEKICVGIFAGGEEKSFFAYSDKKLKFTNKLASEDFSSIVNKLFSNFSEGLAKISKPRTQEKLFTSNAYSAEYFSYLNKHEKGLIEFKEPKILPKSISEREFRSLYKLYIGEDLIEDDEKKTKETLKKTVKSYLKNPVFNDKADKFYKVSNKIISTVYKPSKLDFISCNGNILAGDSIDFTTTTETIKDKLYEFRVLVDGLKIFANERGMKGKGKYYAYFNSPIEKDQIKLLNTVLKDSSKPFELKEVEYLDEAAETLENHEYRKFSSIVANQEG